MTSHTPGKYILTAGLFILVVLGLVWYAKPSGESPASVSVAERSALAVDRPSHDFGTISMKDGVVKTSFIIKNSPGGPIALEKLYTSCMCTQAVYKAGDKTAGPFGMPGHGFVPPLNRTLESGGEAEIEVAFDPAAHGPSGVGLIRRSIMVEGEDGPLVEFQIQANVTP